MTCVTKELLEYIRVHLDLKLLCIHGEFLLGHILLICS